MKRVLGCLLLVSLPQVIWAETGIKEGPMFHCTLESGTEINLERDAEDHWSLLVGVLNGTATVVNNNADGIGTALFNHREENTMVREVLIPNEDRSWFYTVGVIDKGASKEGYLQVMNNGVETAYESCKAGSLQDEFENNDIFEKMIAVE